MKTIKLFVILLLLLPSLLPIPTAVASQDRVQAIDSTDSSGEYVTLEWLSSHYHIPQTELLQGLNKGYSLKELQKALELRTLHPQKKLATILEEINPTLEEQLRLMDFAPKREENQSLTLASTVQSELPEGEYVDKRATRIVSDSFNRDQNNIHPSVQNNVYGVRVTDSVYESVYGTPTTFRSMNVASQTMYPTTYDELAVKRLDVKVNGAPYSIGGSERVSPINGALQLEYTDMTLPGRNGLSFSLTRRYSSSDAIYYNKDILTYNVFLVSYS
ncbi:hypothetical protein [Paenibacillus puerhi]|uniref:hypothetical protein n=1 Tax=Paenibacillus puerhi TaxID=2692622 RepID=UPI00135977AC|nr:hypothetical protein [Paenibacillus puerhi]